MKSKLFILAISILCTQQLSAQINKEQTPSSAPIDTLWFEDGSRYVGSIKDSLFNGYGIMLYSDSTYYEGEWKEGLWNGNGFLRFPGGDIYQGKFVNHKMEGEGIYSYSNGAQYEGNWKNNMFDGVGTLKYADGGYYSGEWKEDKRHGRGLMYSVPDSSLFYGVFEDDILILDSPEESEQSNNYRQENQDYAPKINVSFTYGSNSFMSYSVSYDEEDYFWGGTLSVNMRKYRRGESAKNYDDDGKRILLAGWDEYKIDEINEGEFTIVNLMFNTGWSVSDIWDWGVSLGFGINQKYKNCQARNHADSCPNFDIGEFYYKTKFSGFCISYGCFTRFYIPLSNGIDYVINMGVGNIEGVNFGVGLRF